MSNAFESASSEAEKEDIDFRAIITGALFLCMPSLFLWNAEGGMDFKQVFELYIWYFQASIRIGSALLSLGAIAYAVYRWKPTLFEMPGKNPVWMNFASVGLAILTAIAVGSLFHNWNKGGATFWPATIVWMLIFTAGYWAQHQMKRWWSKLRCH